MKITSIDKLHLVLLAWVTARREFSTNKDENFILKPEDQIALGDVIIIKEISINYENLLGFTPILVVGHYGSESMLHITSVSEEIINKLIDLVEKAILG